MNSALEIIKNKSLAVFGDNAPPKNKGKRALLGYINTCMTLNKAIDNDKIIDIYMNSVLQFDGEYIQKDGGIICETYQEAILLYKVVYRGYGWYKGNNYQSGHYYTEGVWRKHTNEDWDIIHASSQWFTRCLGSLVKTGHLVIIPKGYLLKKIDENE